MTNGAAGFRSNGFTLIEVILTIALAALLTTMFVINVSSILRVSSIEALENEYWKAVDSARANSVFTQQPYFIEWDKEENAFIVSSSGKTERFDLDTDEFVSEEIEVLFEEVAPENSYVLIRGELVSKREIADVGFFPDGTCTPYIVTLKVDDYQSIFQMDPWTGVRLVDPNDEN